MEGWVRRCRCWKVNTFLNMALGECSLRSVPLLLLEHGNVKVIVSAAASRKASTMNLALAETSP